MAYFDFGAVPSTADLRQMGLESSPLAPTIPAGLTAAERRELGLEGSPLPPAQRALTGDWERGSPLPPAQITAISRPEIEGALQERGYIKGAYAEITTPKYTRNQVITMAVDQALKAANRPTRAAKRTPLDPATWKTLVDKALVASLPIAKTKIKKRTLSAPERPRAIY